MTTEFTKSLLQDEKLLSQLSSVSSDQLSDVDLYSNIKHLNLFTTAEIVHSPAEFEAPIMYRWFIDRAALIGIQPQILLQSFEETFGIKEGLDINLLTKFLEENKDTIQKLRIKQLIQLQDSSLPLSSIIKSRASEMDTILKELTTNQQYKYYAQISAQWLKSLEFLAKLLGQFKQESNIINLNQINVQNFLVVDEIKKDLLFELEKGKIPKKTRSQVENQFNKIVSSHFEVPENMAAKYAVQKVG